MTSSSHLILIPSYDTGARLLSTVQAALAHWQPVWVIIDGSTDDSVAPVLALAEGNPALVVMVNPVNRGKGAVVLDAAQRARAAGFTHALVMDADGQHPADHIQIFMEHSRRNPEALIVGRPVFGPEAPLIRLKGRKLSIGLVHFETGGQGIDDPLFGFRVYPLAPLIDIMTRIRSARRYDFDPELAVRLFWAGVPPINVAAPCRYLSPTEGGISHFHYVRDNIRMVWLHTRLITELVLWRWVGVVRIRKHRHDQPCAR